MKIINERFATALKVRPQHRPEAYVEIFANPTTKEWREVFKSSMGAQARTVFDRLSQNLYAFKTDATNYMIHEDLAGVLEDEGLLDEVDYQGWESDPPVAELLLFLSIEESDSVLYPAESYRQEVFDLLKDQEDLIQEEVKENNPRLNFQAK